MRVHAHDRRHSRRRKDVLFSGAIASILGAVALTLVAASAPASTPATSGGELRSSSRSDDFWLSGGSRDTGDESASVAWGVMRGRPTDLSTVYSTRNAGWEEFVNSHAVSGQPAAYRDKDRTLVIQTPPFPENTGSTYAALVSGDYDGYWQRIGALLKRRADEGFAPAIVSVGWEMNGTYMYWGGGSGDTKYADPAQYVAGYRRVVQQLRVTYPDVRTAWVINAHSTPSDTGTTDAAAFYPGDDVVTYIGTDDYDHYPPAPTKEAFDTRAHANAGLYWIADLARAHGKQILVPEWGVAPGSGADGTGDNAGYIQWMYDTFHAWYDQSPRLLEGEFYFADPCGGGNVDSDLIDCNPRARSTYQELF